MRHFCQWEKATVFCTVITRKLEQIAPASNLPRDLRTCELQSINETVYDPETGKFLGSQISLMSRMTLIKFS